MFIGNYNEWALLIPYTDDCCGVFVYGENGMSNGTTNFRILGVRPTFFLKVDVLYKNGDGSKENPYRITIKEI